MVGITFNFSIFFPVLAACVFLSDIRRIRETPTTTSSSSSSSRELKTLFRHNGSHVYKINHCIVPGELGFFSSVLFVMYPWGWLFCREWGDGFKITLNHQKQQTNIDFHDIVLVISYVVARQTMCIFHQPSDSFFLLLSNGKFHGWFFHSSWSQILVIISLQFPNGAENITEITRIKKHGGRE